MFPHDWIHQCPRTVCRSLQYRDQIRTVQIAANLLSDGYWTNRGVPTCWTVDSSSAIPSQNFQTTPFLFRWVEEPFKVCRRCCPVKDVQCGGFLGGRSTNEKCPHAGSRIVSGLRLFRYPVIAILSKVTP
jgi:hypothetical protein